MKPLRDISRSVQFDLSYKKIKIHEAGNKNYSLVLGDMFVPIVYSVLEFSFQRLHHDILVLNKTYKT